ncbi:MAG: hypothetical protein U0401_15855 [Anaerolineae bacterium]
MNPINFLHTKQIDSFQKLRFLLFLEQHPTFEGTAQEYAQHLHLGSGLLLSDIIHELQNVGLLVNGADCWQLADTLEVKEDLQHLAKAFENPLTRQEILSQLKPPTTTHYLKYTPE